jgi:hypothetical protein
MASGILIVVDLRVHDSLGGMFFALNGRKHNSPGQRPGKQERHNDQCPERAKQNV